MNRVNHYLLKNFSSLFASLFFTLFFITSIIFFIKLASITSVIKVDFFELGLMYIYLLPRILIYTLPITFFIAVCISLYNLSKENETIVLFTLGYDPKKIKNFFLVVASLLSFILVIDFLILIPLSKQLHNNFIDYKRIEAKFNIKATEFGQKFSDWLVYINEIDEKEEYKNIVMYKQKTQNEPENLIVSHHADVQNKDAILRLNLTDGKVFQIAEDKITQIDFEKMQINSLSQNYLSPVESIKEYWSAYKNSDKIEFDFIFFALIALFPVATIYFALAFGLVTYRYDKKNIYPKMFSVIFIYLAIGTLLAKYMSLYTIPAMFVGTLILATLFYRNKITKRY